MSTKKSVERKAILMFVSLYVLLIVGSIISSGKTIDIYYLVLITVFFIRYIILSKKN